MSQNNVFAGVSFSSEKPLKQMLFNTERCKAVRICLKKGLTIPSHNGDHGAFFMVLQGKGKFNTEGGEELGVNEFLTIKKGEARGIQSEEDMVILAVRD